MRRILIPLAVALAPTAMIVMPPLTAHAQEVAPIAQTIIASVMGREGTLGAGTADGVRTGALYEIVRDGKPIGQAHVVRTFSARSDVRFQGLEEGMVVTVGDTVRFLRIDAAPLPVPPPVTPPPAAPVVAPAAPADTMPLAPASPAAVPGMATLPLTVNGDAVEIGAGSTSGLAVGKTVPIIRDGGVVAVARVTEVTPMTARGTIIWRDDTAGATSSGDAVQLPNGTAPMGANGMSPVPAARVRFETGGSNAVIPKNDQTYDLLASLAADRLITSQPAYIFHDDGTRRHRTDEDLTFSRSEIATFVREALNSPNIGKAKTRSRIALSSLTAWYGPELAAQGVTPATLAEVGPRKNFEIGFSGMSRATLVGGDDNKYLPAFSERNGSLRARTGFDSRTNIFGHVGDRLTFSAQVDGGSDRQRGVNDKNYDFRRALLSYNAGNVLKGLSVDLGRQEYWWGPGHFGTLQLSDNAGPLNSIHTAFKRGSYQIDSLYAPLGGGPTGAGRSIYGHNIQVHLSDQVRVGFTEMVVSPARTFDGILAASTFSPIPLTFTQRAKREGKGADQTNLLNSAYFEAGMAKGFTGYGELLIDDLSFTDASRVRQRIGTLVGAHIYKPNDPGKVGLYTEYASLEGRTYLRYQDPSAQTLNYDYFYHGDSLGYPISATQNISPIGAGTPGLGGASSLRTDAYWRPTKRLSLGAGLEIADINSELQIISRQQIYRFRASYEIAHNYTLVARGQRISTSNPGFVFGPALRQNLYQMELVRTF